MYILLIVVGVLVAATLLFWTKIKVALNYKPIPGTIGGAIETASGYVVDATADAALQSLAILAWTHDDLATIAKLAEVKAAIQKWQAKPAPLPPVVNVEALAADVAILRSVMASQLTNVKPVVGG